MAKSTLAFLIFVLLAGLLYLCSYSYLLTSAKLRYSWLHRTLPIAVTVAIGTLLMYCAFRIL